MLPHLIIQPLACERYGKFLLTQSRAIVKKKYSFAATKRWAVLFRVEEMQRFAAVSTENFSFEGKASPESNLDDPNLQGCTAQQGPALQKLCWIPTSAQSSKSCQQGCRHTELTATPGAFCSAMHTCCSRQHFGARIWLAAH